MAIYLSEKLKQFRKARDLTQEQIADIFHVSPQAVSRWETDVSFPDIEMLPPIAEFFKVTVDELLGVDVLKNQERIDGITKQIQEKHHKGLTDDGMEICRNALKEFPNNHVFLYNLAHFLSDEESASGDKDEKQKCRQEAVPLYERILSECMDDNIRCHSAEELAYIYCRLGETEKAKELTKKLTWPFRDIVYATVCFISGDPDASKARSDNIILFGDQLAYDLSVMSFRTWEERIELTKKAVLITEILYENGDYGFQNLRLSEYYYSLAYTYMSLKDFDNALDCIEKSAEYAIVYDTLPEDFEYTSLAVRFAAYDKNESVKNYTGNRCEGMLDNSPQGLQWNVFDPIREHERFKKVIAELGKYALTSMQKKEANK